MNHPTSLAWFARHEIGLAWRDWLSMMTAGKPRRARIVGLVLVVLAAFMHLLAYAMIAPHYNGSEPVGKPILVVLSGTALLSMSLMLSQAMESATRAFYARSDLDLILSSPAPARRVFALRIGAIAGSSVLMAVGLAGPFINVLAFMGGAGWLAAYAVVAAIGAIAAALAVTLTVAMFKTIGPKRTRIIAQIAAALVGATFVIGVQAAAIFSIGSFSRIAFFTSDPVLRALPGVDDPIWIPARAAMGEGGPLVTIVSVAALALFAAIAIFSVRFADHVTAAAGVANASIRRGSNSKLFSRISAVDVLRAKERVLLKRDPWLVSQTLMQIFYLIPPALLLWRNFGSATGSMVIVIPVLVMAAGQLAGGLAWLAISGEDAPDLVATAPVRPGLIIRAKVTAVLGIVAIVLAPLVLLLAIVSPQAAAVAIAGIALAATSATAVQLWFRSQASRSMFRRRQTSSRIATFAEAFLSIIWAATAGLAAAGSWMAVGGALLALAILAGTRTISPHRAQAA